jgi:L-alanine-DL-glutamate epimerase-like enolase superfamily enzyme
MATRRCSVCTPPENEILKVPLVRERDYLRVPDDPGIGVELNLAALEQLPPAPREIDTPLHDDGSVADQWRRLRP